MPSQQQSSSPGFKSSLDTPGGVKRSADPCCVCLVSADALLRPPLLLGQIELQNISKSQVISFGWDSQRLASTVSIFLLLWGDKQRWQGSAGFVRRAASDQPDRNSPCYHANSSLFWKWPMHDWFHGPRENANRKKMFTKSKLLLLMKWNMTAAVCTVDLYVKSITLGSLSVWDDCCLTAVTLSFTNWPLQKPTGQHYEAMY